MALREPSGGFREVRLAQFVREQIGFRMTLSLYQITDALTDVHFYIDFGKYIPTFASPSRSSARSESPLPVLFAPENAVSRFVAGSNIDHYWYSAALVETSLDAATLETHYRGQLSSAGWTLINRYAVEPIAFSVWTAHYLNLQMEGILLVLNSANRPNERFALLFTNSLV
jgi:hypothetical protein